MRRFSREVIEGSSNSVIIKSDSGLNINTSQFEEDEENYDLEVQKPSERARILSDNSFFKRLSFKFYSDGNKNYKSMPTLPKHIDRSNSIENDIPLTERNRAHPNSTTNYRSLQNLGVIQPEPQSRVQEEPNKFKIKILQNFRVEMSSPKLKLSEIQSNIKKIVAKQKAAEILDGSLSSRVDDRVVKQQKNPVSPMGRLEKIVRNNEKYPTSCVRIIPSLRVPVKNPEPQISSERSSLRVSSQKQVVMNSFRNNIKKPQSPKNGKAVLVPTRYRIIDNSDDGYTVRFSNNMTPATQRESEEVIQSTNFPRPSLKKYYI